MAPKADASSVRGRRWITPAGLAVVLVAFTVFSAVPHFIALSRLHRESEEFRAAIQRGSQQSEELKDLTKQVQGLRLEVQKYDRLVPASQDKSYFYEAVSKVQDECGLKDVNRAMLAPTKLGRSLALPMELHIVARAEQFYSFLQKLEGLERRSAVSKLSIEADAALSGVVTADMTLSIFAVASPKDSPRP